MPGTGYACVADPATGELVADAGGRVVPGLAAVLGWGAAQVVPGGPGPVFEDAVITTREGHHLLRALPRDGAAPLLAYAHLDRSGSPVALARRALRPAGTPTQRTVSQVRTPDTIRPVEQDRPVAPVRLTDAGPAPIAVPRPSPVPEAERTPPPAVPLPRRAPGPAGTAQPPGPPAEPDRDAEHARAVPGGGRWADDLGTMARILAALRRSGTSSALGS
ncbi:hypothetical protein [Pseudonocardia sp. ICBG1293]|uniref:hypothetical protein n=1 Tax=Pseudonocardia sp. ICBG1293 TaxID=2844382 RepID=UPI001CCD87DB|nr:hypothetical protein [Pseudonocardia sp. ICBG1293]